EVARSVADDRRRRSGAHRAHQLSHEGADSRQCDSRRGAVDDLLQHPAELLATGEVDDGSRQRDLSREDEPGVERGVDARRSVRHQVAVQEPGGDEADCGTEDHREELTDEAGVLFRSLDERNLVLGYLRYQVRRIGVLRQHTRLFACRLHGFWFPPYTVVSVAQPSEPATVPADSTRSLLGGSAVARRVVVPGVTAR